MEVGRQKRRCLICQAVTTDAYHYHSAGDPLDYAPTVPIETPSPAAWPWEQATATIRGDRERQRSLVEKIRRL